MTEVLVPLSRGLFARIDESDAERVLGAGSWHAKPARQRAERYYAARKCNGTTSYLHRFILGASQSDIVDHIDGDGLNCTRQNLRLCNLSVNAINRGVSNAFGYRGVSTDRNRYIARLTVGRRRVRLYGFSTPEDAARAYDDLARQHHGPFAQLNFPELRP